MKISPVIIAKDASKTIGQTLESLKLFDEVIVYDTGSADNTIEIARKFNNTIIYSRPFEGFGESKNKAAELAKYDWILSVDSDEVIGPKLLNSIQRLEIDDSAAYKFRRYNFYRNHRIKHSGWGKEYVVRLYNKTKMRFNDKLVHENIETGQAKIITLEGELMHYSYHCISDFIRKRDLYAELFAIQHTGKRKSSPFMAFIRGTFDFLNTYLIKRGFLDGYRGLLISVSNANVSFYKYLKLYESNISNDKRISLIIRINSHHQNLKLLFNSILFQTITPDEIIISYDFSDKKLLEEIIEFEKISFIPVIQLNANNNNSNWIKCTADIASNEYLIFIDAELILDKNFIFHHSKNAKRASFLKGSSVPIYKEFNELLSHNQLSQSSLITYLDTRYRLFHLIHIILSLISNKFRKKSFVNINSYNFSFFKDDLQIAAKGNKEEFYFVNHVNDLSFLLDNSGLKEIKLLTEGLKYELVQNLRLKEKAKAPKALICLDRLKYLNCGLGQISVNLGRNLLEKDSFGIEYCFLLPAKGFPEFDNKIDSIRLTIFRNLFPWFMKKYELCHVTHQLPQYNFGSAKKNLLTIHDLNFIYTKSKSKTRRYLKKLQQNIDKADAIVFISEFTKSTCYEYLKIPENKIVRVIYNGVQPPGIESEKPNWLVNDKFLFSIGQFLEKKNFHVLIPFIKILPKDTVLVIAGENDTHYGQRMKNLVADNNLQDRVYLPGGISEAEKSYLYHHCHAYVFPSVAEGFGLPVIEAMLCNKPVFCSNRTSLKEIGGQFAFFWENFEPSYMLQIYEQGLEKFNDENYKQKQLEYANSFTHEKNTTEYIKLYRELIEL